MSYSSFLWVFLLLALVKIFHKIWWAPTRMQKLLALQGIKGPSYRIFHGNNKEISKIRKEAIMRKPKTLSHDVYSLIQPHVQTWTNIYGKNYLQWYGCEAQLVVTEPELCKEILNNKDGAYPKSNPLSYNLKKLLGDGLVTTTSADEKWVKLRKLATHAFHGEGLKGMFPAMIVSTEVMLEAWKNHEGKEIEVFEEFRLLTSDVIARTAFGSNHLEGKTLFEKLFKISCITVRNSFKLKIPVISKFFKTSEEMEIETLEKGVHDSIIEIVRKREREAMSSSCRTSEELLQVSNCFGSDFLGSLLKAYHDPNESQRISMDELVDECKTFFFGGQETTNALLAWIVFALAHHSEWQEEARKEVLQIFGKQTIPTPDGIAKMKTMSMIINETLRLYSPTASVINRKVAREVKLGSLTLPAGLHLFIPSLALHFEPKLWGEDVQLFKPERFVQGVTKATNNNLAAFLPFGLGPRICVGMNFATTETKIALAMILQRYSFTLSPGYVHSPSQFLTIRPLHGLQVMLHPLSTNCQ